MGWSIPQFYQHPRTTMTTSLVSWAPTLDNNIYHPFSTTTTHLQLSMLNTDIFDSNMHTHSAMFSSTDLLISYSLDSEISIIILQILTTSTNSTSRSLCPRHPCHSLSPHPFMGEYWNMPRLSRLSKGYATQLQPTNYNENYSRNDSIIMGEC